MKNRKWTNKQKLEVILESLKGIIKESRCLKTSIGAYSPHFPLQSLISLMEVTKAFHSLLLLLCQVIPFHGRVDESKFTKNTIELKF